MKIKTSKIKMACGHPVKLHGDIFDGARIRDAKSSHCLKCVIKTFPKSTFAEGN